MSKKKPIDCPEVLNGCGSICIEVGRAIGYPKRCYEKRTIAKGKPTERKIGGYEYRYTCPNCDKEWLHDTIIRMIFPIESSQFQIKIRDGEEVYTTKDKHAIEHFGLKAGKEYTAEELQSQKHSRRR